MAKEKIKISECSEYAYSRYFLKYFTAGQIRDEGDLNIAKHHTNFVCDTIIDLLSSFEGTDEERIELMQKVKTEIDKFRISDKSKKSKESDEKESE